MKNYKRHKSKTFDEKNSVNGKVMFYFRKSGKKKSTEKNSSNIVIECGGKTLIFSLCSEKLENFSNPSWTFNKLKQTILFLYSQKDLNDSNLTNSNKDSFIQLVNTVDDDNFEKNKTILYNCPNHKTCIMNSNIVLSSEKERNKTYNQRNHKFKDINKISKIHINEEKIFQDDYINKKNNFSIYNQQICNICDLLKPSNKFIFLPICNHTLCINCGKSFYEDLIEKGELKLKCPFYKCSKVLSSISFLKNIISQKHYERLINNKQNFNKKQQNNLNNNALQLGGKQTLSSYTKGTKKSSTINTVDKKISKLEINSILQKYSKKNVLSITKNDDEYLIYNMFRECFCPCCNLPSLFGKTLSNHLKCLNCFKSICKFCFKVVDTDHFNTYSQKCCKNYRFYRFFLWKNKHSNSFTQKRYNSYFENLCLFFVSYILFFIFLFFLLFKIVDYLIPYEDVINQPLTYQDNKTITKFLTISMTVLKRKKHLKYNKCKRIFKRILNILVKILLIWLPLVISIFTFPYYPLYNIIFEFFL